MEYEYNILGPNSKNITRNFSRLLKKISEFLQGVNGCEKVKGNFQGKMDFEKVCVWSYAWNLVKDN